LERTDRIGHISKILYHSRRIPSLPVSEESTYIYEAEKKALENAMKRRNIKAEVLYGKDPGTYRVRYEIKTSKEGRPPLISIIIPFKDKPELLDICVNSILDRSTYQNYEIIGISNNSDESATYDMMRILEEKDARVCFYEYNEPFNYSAINNHAVQHYAKGDHIVLLNNDIEIISPDWIEAMLEFSQRADVGAVGAKLYYPDDTIQHAGVILGIWGLAGHSHKHYKKESSGYFNRLNIIQNLSAVTAACLMVKKNIYDDMKGLNEEKLKVAFNDVDFCLRIREKGYLNVYTPYCEAYHHESISRGADDRSEKIERARSEIEYMKNRYNEFLKNGDPYYNKNLSLHNEDFKPSWESLSIP
jgi:GT2 family glycosyltransferase